jgi:S1-C subfamily serine protease
LKGGAPQADCGPAPGWGPCPGADPIGGGGAAGGGLNPGVGGGGGAAGGGLNPGDDGGGGRSGAVEPGSSGGGSPSDGGVRSLTKNPAHLPSVARLLVQADGSSDFMGDLATRTPGEVVMTFGLDLVRLPYVSGVGLLFLIAVRAPKQLAAASMNVVDLVVVIVVALAAIQGLRLGAIVLLLSFGGFLVGLYLGALLASVTVRWVHTQPSRTAVALVTMLGVATLCGVAGRLVGNLAFARVHRGRLGSVDSVLGVVVAIVASLLAAWLLANTLVNSSSLTLNASIDQSGIIRSLDGVLPAPPSVFSRVQSFLSAEGFPPVFAQLAPASAGPVSLPGNAQLQRAVAHAGASTVKIIGDGCGQIQEGSGFVVGRGLVVTNAHVIAGIPHPMVVDGAGPHQTTVVAFDPSYDLAVLRVRGVNEPTLALDPDKSSRGVEAAVLGYPGGGPFTVAPAGIMAEFEAEGRDIYGQGLTVRDVYEIQAVVRPGNSGGPLVQPDGQVIGVVFSRSTTNGDIGYALASPGVLSRVVRAAPLTSSVGTGPCTSG